MSMRVPHLAGIVEDITFEWLILDGDRHDLDPYVEIVSSYDTSLTVSLIETKGNYVHIGRKDRKVVWMSVLGAPSGEPPRVLYVGTVKQTLSDRRFALQDGTVLQLSKELSPPRPREQIRVLIDPEVDLVTEISPN